MEAKKIVSGIQIIRKFLYETDSVSFPVFKEGVRPSNVIKVAIETLSTILKIKERAGIFDRSMPRTTVLNDLRPDDVYNELKLVLAELVTLKMHFGITEMIELVEVTGEKRPSHVYQQIEYANFLQNNMLRD